MRYPRCSRWPFWVSTVAWSPHWHRHWFPRPTSRCAHRRRRHYMITTAPGPTYMTLVAPADHHNRYPHPVRTRCGSGATPAVEALDVILSAAARGGSSRSQRMACACPARLEATDVEYALSAAPLRFGAWLGFCGAGAGPARQPWPLRKRTRRPASRWSCRRRPVRLQTRTGNRWKTCPMRSVNGWTACCWTASRPRPGSA